MPVRELADPSLANWVHHVQHILPQGKLKSFKKNKK
jgi:radial spoke head protein 4A